jgi:hypothetical protein
MKQGHAPQHASHQWMQAEPALTHSSCWLMLMRMVKAHALCHILVQANTWDRMHTQECQSTLFCLLLWHGPAGQQVGASAASATASTAASFCHVSC